MGRSWPAFLLERNLMKYLVTISIECEASSAVKAIEDSVHRIKTEETDVTATCLSTGDATSVTVLSFDGHNLFAWERESLEGRNQ